MKRLISVITTIFIIFALSASAFAYTSQDISLPSVLGLVKMENLSNTSGGRFVCHGSSYGLFKP